ncbi:MAG: hypothetical protein ACK2TV_01225 [Anaerolineales bacterium]
MYGKRIALVLVLGLLVLMTACNEATELAAENDFRVKQFDIGNHAEIIFEPDDKCTLKVNQDAENGVALKILVKDDTYENYMIAVSTMDEGYTLEDLKSYESAQVAPPYTDLIAYYVFDPGSATIIADMLSIDEGELYFTCQVQGPDSWKNIDSLGPLVITGE